MQKKREKCPVSKWCGGCEYQGMDYTVQLNKKQEKMEELLSSFSKVERIIGMKDPMHYRNKVHHVVSMNRNHEIISGTYERDSHNVVRVEECMIEDKRCQEIIKTVLKLVKSFKIRIYNEDTGFGQLRHILLRRGFQSNEIMVVLVMVDPVFPGKNNFAKALRKEHPEVTSIVLNINDKDTSMVLGKRDVPVFGPSFIKDTLLGVRFRISPQSFYQVNPVQTEVLYSIAMEFAALSGKETVIDAYCGIGTIGLVASKKAKKVIGVELNPDAVKDAKLNARENKIENAVFFQGDASDFMESLSGTDEKIDVVFMDPPRSGSTEKFMKSCIKLSPERIVYVSCGPDTLKRDLSYFTHHGYEVKRIQPVDMFPFTSHVECVVCLSKKCLKSKDCVK